MVILDKMREISTNALRYSDSTEVPTSLWVKARFIYSKQMMFEKEVGKAIDILKDICNIIPPYPVKGLSYVQEMEEKLAEEMDDQIRDSSLWSNSDEALMFMRE
jgi:hypothetical protein